MVFLWGWLKCFRTIRGGGNIALWICWMSLNCTLLNGWFSLMWISPWLKKIIITKHKIQESSCIWEGGRFQDRWGAERHRAVCQLALKFCFSAALSVVPRPAAFNIIWKLIRKGNSWTPPRLIESEAPWVGPSSLSFNKLSRWFCCILKFQNYWSASWVCRFVCMC